MGNMGNLELGELRERFATWLEERRGELPTQTFPASFPERLQRVRALQRALYDDGWARVGWPEALGGLGGSIEHRAIIYDELGRAGFPDRAALEHVEILLPPVARRLTPEQGRKVALPFLRGDELWCQGFSEPEAGSDLAALRTRATRVAHGYRVTGHKIWTSWAPEADRCLLLARTGTKEERHRGLSAFLVDVSAPGITRSAIVQANGEAELAEVVFDDVWVPEAHRVGAEGSGWELTMEILCYERGASSWPRQALLYDRANQLMPLVDDTALARLGGTLLDLFALRASACMSVSLTARGVVDSPAAAPVKIMRTRAEQHLFELAASVLGDQFALGSPRDSEIDQWQREYLFSRAVSIYGGTEQIQYETIGKFLVGLHGPATASSAHPELDELVAAAQGVLASVDDGAEAIAALEWTPSLDSNADSGWSFTRALFVAQGRTLACTPALGALVAAALVGHDVIGAETGSALARVERVGDDLIGVGPAGVDGASMVLVDVPGEGIHLARDVVPLSTASSPLDPTAAAWVRIPRAALTPLVAETDAVRARSRAHGLARAAITHEIVGACEGAFALAVEHARFREQFGKPIGEFQAVAHLLARAAVDLEAMRAASDVVLAVPDAFAGEGPEHLKALAGRNARRVLQATLQVLGAIGFTEDHRHHRFARRVLALDSLWGSSLALSIELARRAQQNTAAWRVPCFL